MQRVRRHRGGIWDWYADQRTGAIYNAAGYHRFKQQFQAHAVTDDGIVPIPLGGLDKDVPPKFVGYIKDGDSALMIMRNGRDKQALFEVSTKQGQVLGTVFEDKEGRYGIVSAPLLTAEGRPVAIPVVGEKTTYHWFDKSLEKEYNVVVAQLPGNPSRVLIQAASKDWQKIVFSTSGNSTLLSSFLYDRSADKPRLVLMSESYRGADIPQLTEPKPISYTARDGLSIPGYLSLPKGVEAKNLPTIVLPHGGPHSRDIDRFDPRVQFLNARGYAVLQPNFRGSYGYGAAFMRAGFKQWGMKMQDDLDDGLDWLVQQGITDSKRVCMVEGSYGGYAALVAGFKSSEKYVCSGLCTGHGFGRLSKVLALFCYWGTTCGESPRWR